MKHNARLPRTAGLRTLSELSTSLTKAGLDPSRIEQRAELIAKARGVERKRKRDEEMDVDEEDEAGEDEDGEGEEGGDWMDVDGEGDDGRSPPKRRKDNAGTAVAAAGKHAPRTNRQTAGMRDQTQVSKAVKLRNLGQRERNMHAKAGESDRAIKVKMVGHRHRRRESSVPFTDHDRFLAEAPVFRETKSGKNSEAIRVRGPSRSPRPLPLFFSLPSSVYILLSFAFAGLSAHPVFMRLCVTAGPTLTGPSHKIDLHRTHLVSHILRCVGVGIYVDICRTIIHQVSTKSHDHHHNERKESMGEGG